jgi:GNAT superfamily N-acetyltransferase
VTYVDVYAVVDAFVAKDAFDPNQPRDPDGQWTEAGGSSDIPAEEMARRKAQFEKEGSWSKPHDPNTRYGYDPDEDGEGPQDPEGHWLEEGAEQPPDEGYEWGSSKPSEGYDVANNPEMVGHVFGSKTALRHDKELMTMGGVPIWAAVVSKEFEDVSHGVRYKRASDQDFHHSMYLSQGVAAEVSQGRATLAWGDRRGIQSMEPMTPRMVESIRRLYKRHAKDAAFVDVYMVVDEFDPNQPRDPDGRWTTAFHGTTAEHLPSILERGLEPSRQRRNFAGEEYEQGRGQSVFLSTEEGEARGWPALGRAGDNPSSRFAVVEVSVPKMSLRPDEYRNEGTSFRHEGRIPAERIRGYSVQDPRTGKWTRHRVRDHYDPNQPRDPDGRWTETGGSSSLTKSHTDREDLLGAIDNYSHNDYQEINEVLRHSDNWQRTEYAQQIRKLDEAFSVAGHDLAEDTTLHRGVERGTPLDRLRAGDTFSDLGFTSTTTDKVHVEGFTFGEGLEMDIRVPAGTRVLGTDTGRHQVVVPEVVLNRGTQFKVASRSGDSIQLDVIPRRKIKDYDSVLSDYDPNQPRVPKGSSEGGEWAPSSGGGADDPEKIEAVRLYREEMRELPTEQEQRERDAERSLVSEQEQREQDAERFTWKREGFETSSDARKVLAEKGITPEELRQDYLGGHDGEVEIDVGYSDSSRMYIDADILDADGRYVGEMERVIDFNNSTAKHNLFQLEDSATGSNIGKDILAGQMRMYNRLGIKEVHLSANIDVGGYAWAKYGFAPSSASGNQAWGMWAVHRADELHASNQIDTTTKNYIKSFARSDDPHAVWHISDLRQSVVRTDRSRGTSQRMTLGKALLLGSSWSGKIKLDDPVAMTRFHAYVERRRTTDAENEHVDVYVVVDGYDPNQPRVPAGDPHGGEWTEGGGGSGGFASEAEQQAWQERAARLNRSLATGPDRDLEEPPDDDEDFILPGRADWQAVGVQVASQRAADRLNDLGITPDEFKQDMLGGHDGELSAAISGHDNALIVGGARRDAFGNKEFEFSRVIDEGGNHVNHAYFKVADALQGSGIGKDILRGQMDMYRKMGTVREVTLDANLDVGGYAWAKYGFTPQTEQGHRDLMRNTENLAYTMLNHGEIDHETYKKVAALTSSRDLKTVWHISDLRQPVVTSGERMTLGKALLVGQSWYGEIRLDDKVANDRFDAYVRRTPR